MAKQTVVFLPGILGSCLKQTGHANAPKIWWEDGYNCLNQIAASPALLKFTTPCTDVAYAVLRQMNVTKGVQIHFYSGLINSLVAKSKNRFDFLEYPYDWRKDLITTAREFGDFLTGHDVDSGQSRCLTIVAHSMGSLVAALALCDGAIPPHLVRRLIFIGGPLCGAPAAFEALFSKGYLSALDWIEKWVNLGGNPVIRRDVLLDAFQSFPSSYQLLPDRADRFLTISGQSTPLQTNPLTTNVIPGDKRNCALEVRRRLTDFDEFISKKQIDLRLLFALGGGATYFQKARATATLGYWPASPADTPSHYSASITNDSSGNATFSSLQRTLLTVGDGTVPFDSANLRGSFANNSTRFAGTRHDLLCNDPHVIQAVEQLLP